MRKNIFIITFIAFLLTSSAWAANISGTWTLSQKNNEGADDSFDLAIKADNENLTIMGNHPKIGTLSGTGTLKGDAINMTVNAVGAEGKGALTFTYIGKVAGDKMSGTKETKVSTSADSQGGAHADGGQTPSGGTQGAPSMAQGGASSGASFGGGAPGSAGGAVSNAWTAEKK